jgi:hypothetical protein
MVVNGCGCKDGERSARNKEMLCFFDTTTHKASHAVSSFTLFGFFSQSYGQVLQKKT